MIGNLVTSITSIETGRLGIQLTHHWEASHPTLSSCQNVSKAILTSQPQFFLCSTHARRLQRYRHVCIYYHGAPSGVILNTLDAVSTGLLVFPSTEGGSVFANLQVQAMSLYLMSTIASQIALTFGSSLFPGALGSMLIKILPFLRGIAISIQKRLGDDNPNVLPQRSPSTNEIYLVPAFVAHLSEPLEYYSGHLDACRSLHSFAQRAREWISSLSCIPYESWPDHIGLE